MQLFSHAADSKTAIEVKVWLSNQVVHIHVNVDVITHVPLKTKLGTGLLGNYYVIIHTNVNYPDGKIHRANMGPTWVLSAPDGPHVGPMNLAIWVV